VDTFEEIEHSAIVALSLSHMVVTYSL